LTSAIQTLLTPQQIQAVAREAAEHLSFPSRNQIALRYEPGQSPVLAVRIQDVFGPSRHAFCTADRMICSWNQRGLDQLGILDLNQKTLTALELPFTDFAAVRAEGDRALAKKSRRGRTSGGSSTTSACSLMRPPCNPGRSLPRLG